MDMRAICFTDNGLKILRELKEGSNSGIDIYCRMSGCTDSDVTNIQESIYDFAKDCFAKRIPLVVVGAVAIAVRMIAPCIGSKTEDIPVIVIDELGNYVIPVLSGHIGGANDIAAMLAGLLEAEAVITTATDINGSAAIDVMARDNNLTIVNKDGIKKVSQKVLKGEAVTVSIKGYPPKENVDVIVSDCKEDINKAALLLRPKKYIVGIGCKKGKTFGEIYDFFREVTEKYNIDESDIGAIASIDLKKDEAGINTLSRKLKIPFVTYEKEMLSDVPGDFSGSDFVKNTVGVDNVCERAAVLLAGRNSSLVVRKTASLMEKVNAAV